MSSHIFTTFFTVVLIGFVVGQDFKCPSDDFSPCECVVYTTGLGVSCNSVPFSQIKSVFDRITPLPLVSLMVVPDKTEDIVPADLLGLSTVSTQLSFSCGTQIVTPLKVDPDAFRFTRDVTNFVFWGCDVHPDTGFNFLAGFQQLDTFQVYPYSSNFDRSFSTLPSLPKLTQLKIYPQTSLDQLIDFPALARGLEYFSVQLIQNDLRITDEKMSQILQWVAQSSAGSLRQLHLNSNRLTKIPEEIQSFTNLKSFGLSFNEFTVLKSGSLPSFVNPVQSVDVGSNGLIEIEQGAFQGNFDNASIHLEQNGLTRFESSVFLDILQGMDQAGLNGEIFFYSNPLDCTNDPCHLSWLLRDNRKFLERIVYPQCSDGTLLEELDPNLFANC